MSTKDALQEFKRLTGQTRLPGLHEEHEDLVDSLQSFLTATDSVSKQMVNLGAMMHGTMAHLVAKHPELKKTYDAMASHVLAGIAAVKSAEAHSRNLHQTVAKMNGKEQKEKPTPQKPLSQTSGTRPGVAARLKG